MQSRLIILNCMLLLAACNTNNDMGTYSNDLAFLQSKGIETVELVSPDGQARVLTVPAWQGRVMTSTATGPEGRSHGWINRRFLEAGVPSAQFNNFGGEERLWLGPEGGANSWYFAPGAEQVFANWKVPAPFDTDVFAVSERTAGSAVFSREVTLRNAKGVEFRIGMRRRVEVLSREEIEKAVGALPEGVACVAYRSENSITNLGPDPLTEATGMPSVWMLGMFNPSETTTVYIPYKEDASGRIVKDDYFGPMPEGRLKAEDGTISFKIDGKFRSKIGVSGERSLGTVYAFDPVQGVLTILKTDIPAPGARFVNSQWGAQDDAFGGDALNSYNDGPTDDGTVMGPFFEIESSSPAAALAPGATLTHSQITVHLEGPAAVLSGLFPLF